MDMAARVGVSLTLRNTASSGKTFGTGLVSESQPMERAFLTRSIGQDGYTRWWTWRAVTGQAISLAIARGAAI